jgi:hypothetical protein
VKTAKIFPITSKGEPGYAWKWRCAESNVESKDLFTLYYDCVTDARKQGYQVDLSGEHRRTASDGAL